MSRRDIFEVISEASYDYSRKNGREPKIIYIGRAVFDQVKYQSTQGRYLEVNRMTGDETIMGMEVIVVLSDHFIGFGDDYILVDEQPKNP